MKNPSTFLPLNNNSQQPLLPQASPNNSSSRWKVILLTCLCTFGICYSDVFVRYEEDPFYETFHLDLVTENTGFIKIHGFSCIAPFIAGIVIYHSGVIRAYRFFILLLAIGRSFTFVSFQTQIWTLFVIGESLFYAANYGLLIAQIDMIIKWFRGKELSLAVGIVGLTNNVVCLLALYLYSMNILLVQRISSFEES